MSYHQISSAYKNFYRREVFIMDINFNKSTNITWKPDNTLEVASSNGHVSKIAGVSFANYLLVKDNPKLLKLIEKRAVPL